MTLIAAPTGMARKAPSIPPISPAGQGHQEDAEAADPDLAAHDHRVQGMALDLLVDEKEAGEGQGLPGMGVEHEGAAVTTVPPSVAPTRGIRSRTNITGSEHRHEGHPHDRSATAVTWRRGG